MIFRQKKKYVFRPATGHEAASIGYPRIGILDQEPDNVHLLSHTYTLIAVYRCNSGWTEGSRFVNVS